MPRTTLADVLAEFFRSIVPEAARRADETRSEHVQTGVWLVGLASAMLALFVSNRDKVAFVSNIEADWIVSLLGFSVLAGVAQRIVLLIGSAQEYNARIGFMSWLRASEISVNLAEPLSQEWSNDEILRRLKEHYELDYTFLLTFPSPEEQLRQAYAQVHSSWEKLDRDRLHSLFSALGAWAGWTEAEVSTRTAAAASFESSPTRSTIHYTTLFKVGGFALMGGSLAFGAAVVVLCIGFLA
jgi:hypothetical protein